MVLWSHHRGRQLLRSCSSLCRRHPTRPPHRIRAGSGVVGDTIVRPRPVALVVFPTIVVALGWFLNRTKHGVAVRAAADNPSGAGGGHQRGAVSTIVWTWPGVGRGARPGGAAGGRQHGSTGDLGPSMLLRTFAARSSRMASLPVALAGRGIGVSRPSSSTTTRGTPAWSMPCCW